MKLSMATVASLMNDNTNDDVSVSVKEVWKDYGAGTYWDTIVVEGHENNLSYQCLSPREHARLQQGYFTLEDVEKLIAHANKYCSVRKEN